MIAGGDEHDYMLAKKQAQVLRISVAEFVRRVIRDALPIVGQNSRMKFVGLVESGDPQSSQSILTSSMHCPIWS